MFILSTRISDITVEEILQFGFPVLFGMAIISLVLYLGLKHARDAENDARPVQRANAKVIDKQQVAPNSIVFEIWILFETESGERVRVSCPANNNYVIGDCGCLSWQGSKLHSFQIGKSAPIIDSDRDRVMTQPSNYPSGGQGYIPAWKRVEMMEKEEGG